MNEYQQALTRIIGLEDKNAELLGALKATLEALACWKLECPHAWDDGDENAVAQATEAIRKAIRFVDR